MQRIEQVLTESQRTAYREMLGPPFDLYKIRFSEDETAEDANNRGGCPERRRSAAAVAAASRPTRIFDTKVARPSYRTEHPRVLFDEAHNNFHTTDGRYKPFAEVIANDGFKVIPTRRSSPKTCCPRETS